MKTYTSTSRSLGAFLTQARAVLHIHRADAAQVVESQLQYMRRFEQRLERWTGLKPVGLDVLVVGPGQRLLETRYFGARNRVTAIDMDVIAAGVSPLAYAAMLRHNGVVRTAKTIARKCTGIDARVAREMRRRLESDRDPDFRLLRMDATRMEFPDNSFDLVYSFSVFEHIGDPEAALREVARVLRPGGACYLSIHQYGHDTGCHDPRIWANMDRPPYWAHLRPQHAHLVDANAYVNKLRLDEWRSLLCDALPGVHLDYEGHFNDAAQKREKEQLAALRAAGELADYSDEELLLINIVAAWQKGACAQGPVERRTEHTGKGEAQ